ncbi:uncharacterized protein LOC117211715 [Bombus bifarius]|uniref:Uncharacterized protein LOC117211715 n=1 Tax=Bombus bifarius TaxID=103933 RepID=A0A6P8NB00_9HYME|nr:uncharacterized protein LOC117211715 [Bombus bifarius]XP_033311788.1 uncharacterized protein LOC117211715 [Bombus bifarius]XP_033311790.1 uncharacterized protein LOC117211715 [Bombus bifarius]
MKQILAVCLLLTVADANVFRENHGRPLNRFFHPKRWFPSPEHQFESPGHSFPIPEHLFPTPGHSLPTPAYMQVSSDQSPFHKQLEKLFPHKVNQQNKASESCTAVRICHSPLTGEIIITEFDGIQPISNENLGCTSTNKKYSDNVNSNNENLNSNGNVKGNPRTTMPILTTTSQSQTSESPHNYGEGIIDIRMGY